MHRKTAHLFLTTMAVVALLPHIAAADTVFLKDGTAVSGTIQLPVVGDEIKIKTSAGLKTYTREQVRHFRMPRRGPDNKPLLGPDGKPIIVDLMFPPEPIEMPFTIDTDHYTIKTDISERVAKNIAKAMQQLHRAYVKVFRPKNGEAGKKAEVIVFEKKKDFLAYARRVAMKPRHDTLGFFRPRTDTGGEIVTYKRKDGDNATMRTLYHEATHQFVLMMTGVKNPPPLWVNEGLAVYFESSRWHRGKFQTGRIPKARLAQLQKALRERDYIHLPDLVARGRDTFDALCYAESWSLVYFFVKADKGRYSAKFTNYFRALKAGVKHDAAFKKHLTANMPRLERLWKRFVLGLKSPNGK